MIFSLYYLLSPMYMLTLYYMISKNPEIFPLIICILLLIFTYSLHFTLNLISSQISRNAHSPRKVLYSYVSTYLLQFNENMKVMTFIERLCGPEIGFYCMDWFPMNSNEFYQYCAYCLSMFILCNQLFESFE